MKGIKDLFQVARNRIQSRLLLIFLLTMAIVFVVNSYVYMNMDELMKQTNDIYSSNARLNELQTNLKMAQEDMTSYLNDKNTESLKNYYIHIGEYQKLMEELNKDIIGNDALIMEKNIYNMSLKYCDVSEQAIDYRRGYLVEKFKKNYEEATILFNDLNSAISALNGRMFTDNYGNSQLFMNMLYKERHLVLVIFGVTTLLSITLIMLFTMSITKPLTKLSETAQKVGDGQFDVELVEVTSDDEVGTVATAFNRMIVSIRDYIEQIKQNMEAKRILQENELKMETYLKDAQLKYLQAQISPHFLFNTLNAGAQLAMLEDADRTYTYIQKVAEFYRYNVKKDNGSVTLREEIELVDNYIYIINVRFSGEIHYRKEIDDSLLGVYITAMTLQPFVENCINHGLRGIDWQGEIVLSVYKDGTDICVSISDNGVGMPTEKIEELLKGNKIDSTDPQNSNGIGINNVINRLALFYEKDNTVEIYSDGENMGTEFIIRIPGEQ